MTTSEYPPLCVYDFFLKSILTFGGPIYLAMHQRRCSAHERFVRNDWNIQALYTIAITAPISEHIYGLARMTTVEMARRSLLVL